jgi:hypothetical protein
LPLNGSLVSIRSVEPSGVKWSYVSGSTLEIQPLDFDETLTVVAAITISMTDTDIPEACYPYEDGIAHGAMRTIAMISHSPWFNAALAEYHNTEFTKEIRRGKMQYARGHYSNPQYVQIPRF